jgi:hypothetical protein
MQKSLIAILAIALIAGCAAKPQYTNTAITDPAQASRQMAIDDGECTRIVMSGAPVPQVQQSGVGGRTVSGTVTDGLKTYNYSGISTPTNSFSSGFANGMNMRAAADAKAAQHKIYNGCMLSKGWTSK